MRIPTPVEETPLDLKLPFFHASTLLFTVAHSLSKAAQAMAEAALAISQVGEEFATIGPVAAAPNFQNNTAPILGDKGVGAPPESSNESLGSRGSNFGSSEGDICE